MNKIDLPKRFSSPFISKIFYPWEYKHDYLSSINTGRCYDWAYYAYCLWPNVKLWTSDCHAWVQIGKKFYDSEAKYGVHNYDDLPCNTMWGFEDIEPHQVCVEEFQSIWNSIGGGRRRHWNTMQKEILEKGLCPIRK